MTKEFGAPGELDENNVVRNISVVPAPFQQPYPPIFQSFSMSPKTIEYAAKNSIVPFMWFAWYFDQGLMSWDDAQRQLELFAEHIIPEFGD